eukprot:jgi/Phyca11/127389/e_gw1.68.69.1
MVDDVVEAPYCVVCRRSSACKWRKHVFLRGHQQATQQFLLHHVSRIQTLFDAATSDSSGFWRCVFCDAALATGDAVTHLGSDAHRKQVEAFCRHHRCDANRQLRPQLWLNAVQRREVRCQAFLTSAASRLQEVVCGSVNPVEVKQGELLGPQVAKRYKTVSSVEGVVQNPLGRHEGKRVWGGGIVKLRKHEWIPWTVDQLVREEQAGQPETHQAEVNDSPFAHRVTELAQGGGLSSIASVSWGASVGNVHTAAVPPWMVQTEEEYKQFNRREQTAPPPSTRTIHKAERKRKDIFSELQSKSEYGPDWLPNFGGVWQEGSRSKTKQAFRKTSHAQPSPADKASNPLDAKKQLLLAQKERLRAKMAARRRK